jgi:hypothetical protein
MGDFESSKDPAFNTHIKNRLQSMAFNRYPEQKSHKRIQKDEKEIEALYEDNALELRKPDKAFLRQLKAATETPSRRIAGSISACLSVRWSAFRDSRQLKRLLISRWFPALFISLCRET